MVTITLGQGQLGGTLQTNDGIMGMILTGISEAGGYTLGTPILVTGTTNLTTQGITVANNPFAVKHVGDYYQGVGQGAQLYLMLVPNNMTIDQIMDDTNANGAVKLLNFAQGDVKVLGSTTDDAAVSSGIATAVPHAGAGGTGVVLNDTFYVTGGTRLAIVKASTVVGGAVTGITIIDPGQGYTVSTNISTTNLVGTGTGFKVDISALTTITVTNGINASISTAVTKAQALATYYAGTKQWPLRVLIGASSYSGVAGNLTNYTSGTSSNRVGLVLGDSQIWNATYAGAAIGLCLGRVANIPVQRKISRVKDGPITGITEVYLGTVAIESAGADPATIASKGYITFQTIANKSGYYWSGDQMCTTTNDDYQFLARGRVIDKMDILAYSTYINEQDDELPVNTDGTLNAGFAKWLEQQIINSLNTNMVANKNLSPNPTCFIDPTQNVVETNTINMVVNGVPMAYAMNINITLGFAQ